MIHDEFGRNYKEAVMIERYLTLDGQILELQDLSPTERSYLDRCITAFDQRVGWFAFSQLVEGTANPLLAATCGRVTQTVWAHPLYQTIRDLEDRLGLEQGHLAGGYSGRSPGRSVCASTTADEP